MILKGKVKSDIMRLNERREEGQSSNKMSQILVAIISSVWMKLKIELNFYRNIQKYTIEIR